MALINLPQLASEPYMAHFIRFEHTIAFASFLAFMRLGAFTTSTWNILVAPSPSAAIALAKYVFIYFNASANTLTSSVSASVSTGFPAIPFANIITVSFVDISPSTDTML